MSRVKRNQLITGSKGDRDKLNPETWTDADGNEWLLGGNADLDRSLQLNPIVFAALVDRLVKQGLLEQRTLTIQGRERTGWRVKLAALNFQRAMLDEEPPKEMTPLEAMFHLLANLVEVECAVERMGVDDDSIVELLDTVRIAQNRLVGIKDLIERLRRRRKKPQ